MNRFSLDHLSNDSLLHDLSALAARERSTTALLLAHIAEVEARQLYLPAAYPSMFAWCMGELHLSEDATAKRLHAARAARKFPVVFEALAEGRVHLSAVVLLAPHLTEGTVGELLAAATHRSKAEIEKLLAARSMLETQPQRDSSGLLTVSNLQHAPGHVSDTPQLVANSGAGVLEHAPGHVDAAQSLSPGTVTRAKVTPTAPGIWSLQVPIDERTHDKLRHAQALLSHSIPSGDLAQVLDRALDALIGQIEKRKFAATAKPRANTRPVAAGSRHIPANIRRAVRERDQDQCAFVSEGGRRCSSRRFLEFDHIDEVACGGEASVDRIRLLCRAHNQHAAECTFGVEFMRQKRAQSREAAEAREAESGRAAAEAREAARAKAATEACEATRAKAPAAGCEAPRAKAAPEAREAARAKAAPDSIEAGNTCAIAEAREAAEALETAKARAAAMAFGRALEAKRALDRDVTPWLRSLKFRAEETRMAAAYCETLPDAPIEQRVRAAISFLRPGRPRPVRVDNAAAAAPNRATSVPNEPGAFAAG